jgi:hypothetical protein
MDDSKTPATTGQTPATSTREKLYGFLVPVVIGIVITKLLGLAGGLVSLGLYVVLRPKMGALTAVLVSALLGAATAAVVASIK